MMAPHAPIASLEAQRVGDLCKDFLHISPALRPNAQEKLPLGSGSV
jgi:hypothetical protein